MTTDHIYTENEIRDIAINTGQTPFAVAYQLYKLNRQAWICSKRENEGPVRCKD